MFEALDAGEGQAQGSLAGEPPTPGHPDGTQAPETQGNPRHGVGVGVCVQVMGHSCFFLYCSIILQLKVQNQY